MSGRNRTGSGDKQGSAIVIAFMLMVVITIVVAGAIILVSHEFKFSAQSSSRTQALNSAEAGIEMALATYQQQVISDAAAWDNWVESISIPGEYTLAYSSLAPSGQGAPDSEFMVVANTGVGVVTASGRLAEPGVSGGTLTRTVQVTIATNFWNPWVNAMTGKGIIDLTGTVEIDSFNSQDPNWSTSNQYDSTKSASNAVVATIATNDPGIIATGGGYIDGEFVAGVGGAVDVGGAFTLNGIATNGYEQDIPDVKVPISTVQTDLAISGTQTINVLGTRDMSVPEIRLVGAKTLTISGSGLLRIYVDGETYFSGSSTLVLTPNPPGSDLKVEIYANDDVLLNNVLNQGGYAGDFAIYGTPNCEGVHFTGADDYAGTIYAPQADILLSGSGDFMGSIVGNNIHTTGDTGFHWDESLATNKTRMITGYQIDTWREL